jgi:hypothetical protein
MTHRAILIDPRAAHVCEVVLPSLDRNTIAATIGVKWLDISHLGSGVAAFVDDVGLKRKDQRFWHFTMSRVVMAGRALLLSIKDGETVALDPRADLVWTKHHVAFIGGADAVEANIRLGLLDRPGVFMEGWNPGEQPRKETLWSWTPDECVMEMEDAR